MAEDFDKTRDDIPNIEDNVAITPSEYSSKTPQNVGFPYLEVISGPKEGLKIPLEQGEQILGRSRKQAAIRLEDTSVSRMHTRLNYDGQMLTVQDLGSRNGTLINGRKIEGEAAQIQHLDRLKIGIYVFRFVEKEFTQKDINAHDRKLDEEILIPEKEQQVLNQNKVTEDVEDKTQDNISDQNESIDQPDEIDEMDDLDVNKKEGATHKDGQSLIIKPNSKEDEDSIMRRLGGVFLIICLITGISGLIYFYNLQLEVDQIENPEEEIADIEDLPEETNTQQQPTPSQPSVTQPTEPQPEVKIVEVENNPSNLPTYRAFLDIRTKPMSAKVSFEGKLLGETPIKANVELEPGKEYTVIAEYDLRDINDKYQQKLNFIADVRKEVVELNFDADIGVMKIQKLPRDIRFYLEGYYAHDQLKSHPVKISDIIYGKPIYIPFGLYKVELREKVRVGESETYVDEIRYHREFELNTSRRVVDLDIKERDLQFFPAKIFSLPQDALVYLNGEKIGTTPFEGELPLGKLELKLIREGYFDYSTTLEMRTNTPYEAKIVLQTSKVGGIINESREIQKSGDFKAAIDKLVEALKLEPSDREKAETHLLIGNSYYMLKDYQQALSYYEQAKAHPDFYHEAKLGLARTHFSLGDKNKAIPIVVENLVNLKPEDKVYHETISVFNKVSNLKSIMYISTEPSEATVKVNDRLISQKTPLILSDLALGNYRIVIEKDGFKTNQIKKNLTISEFVPIHVKLEADKL